MIYLFIASLVLVLYGTLFPFTFQADAHAGSIVAELVASVSVRPGGGDILSNSLLFLPFGFFGMQALPARLPTILRYVLVVMAGVATSIGIEIAQYYMTMRTTSVYDLGLNAISVLTGAAAGVVNWPRFMAGGGLQGIRPRTIFPLVLIAAWALYRLFPYVPTIDFQQVKDALKPLLAIYPLPVADVIRHFGMVLGLALLLQSILSPARARLALPVMALGVIAAKPFIITRTIAPAELAGTLVALAIWFAVLHRAHARAVIIAFVFAAALVFQGFTPFELRSEPASLSYIPFSGFEQGSMSVNIQSFLEKVFLYGTLIWLILQTGASTSRSIVLMVILTTSLEIAQRYIVGRTPEITDPLLVLLLGGLLLALERHSRSS